MCQPRGPFPPGRARQSLSFLCLRSCKHQTGGWNSAEASSHSGFIIFFFLVASLRPAIMKAPPPSPTPTPRPTVAQGSHLLSAAAPTCLPVIPPSQGHFPGESFTKNREDSSRPPVGSELLHPLQPSCRHLGQQ